MSCVAVDLLRSIQPVRFAFMKRFFRIFFYLFFFLCRARAVPCVVGQIHLKKAD